MTWQTRPTPALTETPPELAWLRRTGSMRTASVTPRAPSGSAQRAGLAPLPESVVTVAALRAAGPSLASLTWAMPGGQLAPSVPGQQDGPRLRQVLAPAVATAVVTARPAGAALAWARRRAGLLVTSAVRGAQLRQPRLLALARAGLALAAAGLARAAGPPVGRACSRRVSPTTPSRSRPSRWGARRGQAGIR